MVISPSTFSIVAYDPQESAWGVAVASKFLAVGSVVPWANAGAGAVATQSYANTTFGKLGLEMMRSGKSAQEALQVLISQDNQAELRQVGMVDALGQAATYTGNACYDWAGGRTGAHYAVQGNILSGPQVIEAMAVAFESFRGSFPQRLFHALLAGDQAGGDRRGRQSAAMYIAKTGGGYAGFNDRWVDLRVDDHTSPIAKLGELLDLHYLYSQKSPPENQVDLKGSMLKKLQSILTERGYYTGPIHGEYDPITRKALEAFIGNENFEDRVDLEKGRIDQPVYEYLVEKFEKPLID